MILDLFKISRLSIFLFLFSNGILFAQVESVIKKSEDAFMLNNTKVYTLDYKNLLEVKANIENPKYRTLYKDLIKQANAGLKEGSYTVMQKTQTPPSSSKHDYYSIGPYWWPDPSKPDGLPWIRRDGEINPLTREGSTDYEIKEKMFHSTNKLALAYFFSDNIKYANKALQLIKVWFLNKETKMNPNLNYAQGIPGENTGRGIGIIEFAGIHNIITAIEILELNHLMDAGTSQELRYWFSDYVHWLQTSDNGIFEKNTKNNHGTHYDAQLVKILLFLERIEEAKQLLESVKKVRIDTQISPNGAQPHELSRTKAMSYSTMNIRGFTELAIIGRKLGVDLWGYKGDNGASICNAYEFLKPYAKGEKKWDFEQLGDLDKAQKNLKQLFAFAGSEFNIDEYCQIGKDEIEQSLSLLNQCN